jgi:hypothetical protein
MAKKSSTTIKKLKELPEPILECIGPVDPKKPPQGSWRYGILATDTVVYTSGRIARAGEKIHHDVDPEELERCRTLARGASWTCVPSLASEGDFIWESFFIAANRDDPIPERIDESLIRDRFGGTILPVAPIAISPIDDEGPWWVEISRNIGSCQQYVTHNLMKIDLEVYMERSLAAARDLFGRGLTRYGLSTGDDQKEEAERLVRAILQVPDGERMFESHVDAAKKFLRVLNLAQFFKGPEFLGAAYVEIGEEYSRHVPEKSLWPNGLESWPCCFPRLLVGLTRGGSLTGLMGYVVAT